MRFRSDEGFNHKVSSEITPLAVYEQRRAFLHPAVSSSVVSTSPARALGRRLASQCALVQRAARSSVCFALARTRWCHA